MEPVSEGNTQQQQLCCCYVPDQVRRIFTRPCPMKVTLKRRVSASHGSVRGQIGQTQVGEVRPALRAVVPIRSLLGGVSARRTSLSADDHGLHHRPKIHQEISQLFDQRLRFVLDADISETEEDFLQIQKKIHMSEGHSHKIPVTKSHLSTTAKALLIQLLGAVVDSRDRE